jgi:uncharacterized protein YdcH (DUF465 family)
MAEGLQDLKQHLMATNDEFQRLATEHQSYKDKLQQLAGKPYLTDQEQFEEARMKKLKLHLKDQMEAMMSEYRKQAQSA